MAAGGNTDGVRSSSTSSRTGVRLRLAALAELLAQSLHGLEQGFMHVLGHHRIIHLHPELARARHGRAPNLDEEEVF